MSILRYRLGDWTILPELHRLEGSAGERSLEPKVMELLECLIEADGDVVSKADLVERVWNGHRIADSALTRSVSELRRALGDDAQDPIYIETIPKRGYRLVAPVERTDTSGAAGLPVSLLALASGWRLILALLVLTVAVVVSMATRNHSLDRQFVEQAPSLAPVRLMQVSTAPGLEAFPDYSPDGTRVVYSAPVDGRFELFVQQMTPGGARIQLTADGLQNVQPDWSPDGQKIAFHSIVRGGIWVVPALGGEVRRIVSFGSSPVWLPDSRSLVFQSEATVGTTMSDIAALPPSILYRVDLERGAAEALTVRGTPSGGHGHPRVSPDGERVVFAASDLSSRALYTIKTDGSDLQPVLGAPQDDAVFSPDGRYIYSTGGFNGEKWLWRTPISTATGEALAAPERVVRGAFRDLSFAATGDRLIASNVDQSSNIFALALDRELDPELDGARDTRAGQQRSESAPGRERQLTRGTNFRDTSPVVSPDGLKVAYRQKRFGQLDQIWLVSADGSSNAQLTLDPNISAHFPGWSPDGGGVVFQTHQDGRKRVLRVGVTDRQVEPWLDVVPQWDNLRLSRDGTLLTFHTRVAVPGEDGEPVMANNVFQADRTTLEARRLTSEAGFAGFAVLSTDNRRVAYEVERDGRFQLAVRDLETGEVKDLTDRGNNWPGAFIDDRRFAFVAQRDGLWNLYSVDVETGVEVKLTNNTTIERYYRNPDAARDGTFLVFERGDVDGDLWEIVLEG